MQNEWLIEERVYKPEKELLMETLFTLSNGYMASRGTLEEGKLYSGIKQYYGTYVAGIFDKYNWEYQAIVNLPHFFNTQVWIDDEPVDMTKGKVENYIRYLDMRNGLLVREFRYTNSKDQTTEFKITRFISKANEHLAVLHYNIKPINYNGKIEFKNSLDGNVTNIDFHISGYQLRDEKYYFIDEEHEKGELKNGAFLKVKTKKTKREIMEAFKIEIRENCTVLSPDNQCEMNNLLVKHKSTFNVQQNNNYSCLKVISVYTNNDKVTSLFESADNNLNESLKKGYEQLLEEHQNAWHILWDTSDVKIKGSTKDQQSVRFNIFHVIQMGNKHNPYVNIGSRGLTSEMHYGNCFWDTELFIMPFFIYTDPDTAKSLVKYRYLTLPEARNKAKRLWFEGAMYPWMSSYPGKEQADYWEYANIAVHVVCDVTFGLINYFRATNDMDFMVKHGLEMLIETSRFWASRVDYNTRLKKYAINTVKGPNEYDGVVNNNTYTNWCARWNLIQGKRFVELIKKKYPKDFQRISKKINFKIEEMKQWTKIINNMFIHYDKKKDLYIEDDIILDKRPVNLKKMKPGKKITTELGLTWDTILRHKVVKQADILLLMYLHREYFTNKQLRNAWNFYEPITLHDSSLSYNTHSIIAAELGLKKKSYDYFLQTAELDIDDLMENAFLGIHSANAGGTWQCVVNGFCGMRVMEKEINFTSRLPEPWKEVEFKIFYKQNLFKIKVDKKKVGIELVKNLNPQGKMDIKGNKIIVK